MSVEAPERYLPSSMLACAITFLLFWMMQALVVVEERRVTGTPGIKLIPSLSVHQPIRAQPPRTPKPVLPKLNNKPQTPSVVPSPKTDLRESAIFPIGPLESQAPLEPNPSGTQDGELDRSAIALVRIPPTYPERALRRGIEGRVLVEFTISRSGAVENPIILAAEPTPIFNASALKAIRQWRYNPKIENGVAVPQHGIQISIPFRRDSSTSGGSAPAR